MLLKEDTSQTHHFLTAAQDITEGMGGVQSKHFAEWLARTVGEIKTKDSSVLDALHALRQYGNLLATTNYDDLALGEPPTLRAVTWRDTDELLSAVRDWDTDTVAFLHGYWRRPESVVLDWKSYEQIARDEQYRNDLAAFWKTNTWVYVGCGLNGLSDPDFGLLLDRYGERARQADHWDYCLVCGETQRQEFQARFDTLKVNIRAVSYGGSHSNLPGYLRSLLPESVAPPPAPFTEGMAGLPSIPAAPAFYGNSDYIGLHQFVGREAELNALNDWGNRADPTNLFIVEAIGGNGKSMLTWEWTTKHATNVRPDWAGRFWYSFYERGASMQDFCHRALAYMTGRPLKEFAKRKTAEMQADIILCLHNRPWLLILDGLERVLVAYHRIDAAEVPDEEINAPIDKALTRNPCDAIYDEDSDLLRALAAVAPSKILISTRLTPRVLLNPSGQTIAGGRRLSLPGLRPSDAEKLMRFCGVEGDSVAIQSYLTTNCENHPLVIGVLAGLVNDFLPSRGNFDAWSVNPDGGCQLDLGQLTLTQRRNHILDAAFAVLPERSVQLLSTLALLSGSVDYETLEVFNPHLLDEPEKGRKPVPPERDWDWELLSTAEKAERRTQYEAALARWEDYRQAVKTWRESAEYCEAPRRLRETVRDLERRSLLQYDGRKKRYDLHPVVRGVAARRMKPEERQRYGERVVDYFSSLPHNPYEYADTLDDLHAGLSIVRTLQKLGRYEDAFWAYAGDLASALLFTLEANSEIISILRPFFSEDWKTLPNSLSGSAAAIVANHAGIALHRIGEYEHAFSAHCASLLHVLDLADWGNVQQGLFAISDTLAALNRLANQDRCLILAARLADVLDNQELVFLARLNRMVQMSNQGRWKDAEELWRLLDPMERSLTRLHYLPGEAECRFAQLRFRRGDAFEEFLAKAEDLANAGKSRSIIRDLRWLRGAWHLEQREWALALPNLQEAVRMAQESRIQDAESETGLALAKFHLGQLTEPRREAERLTDFSRPSHRNLAMLWLALDDEERAKRHAIAAYKWAWGQGEPYFNRYELTKVTELLRQMDVQVPHLLPYDAIKVEELPWEDAVAAAVDRLADLKKAEERLRSFPPEFFDSKTLSPPDMGRMTLTQARSFALEFYKRGDYAKANELLMVLVDGGFELPSSRCHLARIALMTERFSDAAREVAKAWALRAEGPAYVIPRILWLRLCLSLLELGVARTHMVPLLIGQLKSALKPDDAFMEWTMEPVLSHVQSRLHVSDYNLLSTLVAALSDRAKLHDLESSALWRDQKPISLDVPWPE